MTKTRIIANITITLFIFASSLAAANADNDFYTAKGMYNDQLYDLAASQFRQFVNQYPQHPHSEEAGFLLGECYFQAGQYMEAISAYQKLLADYPAVNFRDKAYYRIGEAQVNAGQHEQALKSFQTFFTQYPNSSLNSNAYYWYAEALYHTGNTTKALEYYARVYNMDKSGPLADYSFYSAAFIYEEMKKWDQALKAYRTLLENHTDSPLAPGATFRMGLTAYGKGDYQMAVKILNKAIELYPNHELRFEAQYFIGESYFKQDMFSKALQAYQLVAAIPENNFADDALYSMGWAYFKQDQNKEAADAFIRAAEMARNEDISSSAYFQAGRNYIKSGDNQAARKAFKQVTVYYAESSDAPNAFYELGSMDFQNKQYAQARTSFMTIVENYKVSEIAGQASLMIGECFTAEKNTNEAIRAFELSDEYFETPNIKANALYKLGKLYYDNGNYDKALDYFKQVNVKYTKNPIHEQSVFWTAETLFKLEKYQQSREHYNMLIKNYPTCGKLAEAWYGLGYANLKAGDNAAAEAAFAKAAELTENKALKIDAILRQGDTVYNTKEYIRAIRIYESVLLLDTNPEQAAEAHFQIGHCYYRNNNFHAAKRAFTNISRDFDQTLWAPEAQFMTGRCSFRLNSFQEAVIDFQSLLYSFPESNFADDAVYAIGDCYYNMAEYDKAVTQYRQLLDKYPGTDLTADAVNGIQWSMVQKGDSQGAMNMVENYIKQVQDPDLAARIRVRMAEFAENMQLYDQAIAQYQLILKNYPDSGTARNIYYHIGKVYHKFDDPVNALRTLERQWTQFPNASATPDALWLAASIYKERNDPQSVISTYNKFLETVPDHEMTASVYNELGNTWYSLQNMENAEQAFHNGMSKSIDDRTRDQANMGLARVNIKKGQLTLALDQLQKIIENPNTNTDIAAEAQYLTGEAYKAQSNYQNAVVAFLKIKYIYSTEETWVVQGVYQAAACNEQLEKLGEARRLYDAIIRDYSNYPEYQEKAKDRLQKLAGR